MVMSLPWLVLGDFNEILFHHEKEGGRTRPQGHLQAFHDALMDCGLEDVGYEGDLFTWRRGKVRERLDRGVANDLWNVMFLNAILANREMLKSDHRPLILDTEGMQRESTHSREGARRFEARWLKEETVAEIVHAAWERAASQGQGPDLMIKVNAVHADLHAWDRDVLKKPVQRMKKLRRDLEKLRRGPMSDESTAAQKEILLQLELLLEQEEIVWVQRARANWLKHGGRNTNFFHHCASSRRKKNWVKSLVDDQGVKQEDNEKMKDIVKEYFVNLFSSEVHQIDQSVFSDIRRKVTSDMNQLLLAPFDREEVRKALFNIGDLKAPGPDGLHAIFYKRFWDLLGNDLVDEVL